MGLDMYLTAKRYLSEYDADEKAMRENIAKIIGAAPGPVKYVEVEAMYWRKANHIHRWFVEHCQEGKDECQTTYVSREKLRELRDLCRAVLKDPPSAGTVLPTQSGFFFGSTDYDEYYFEDTQRTADTLDKLLSPEWEKDWEFYYHSSW